MSKKKNTQKKRRTILLLICCLVAALYGLDCMPHRVSPKLQDEYIRSNLSQDMRDVFNEHKQSIPGMMKKNKIPGLSIAVVDRDGILWTAGFGYTDYNRKKPVTTDTIFLLCSMSKAFTATAVMCAVQDGLVSLDVPVTEYIPQFTINSRFEENPQDKITLRNLLNHTSGLDHETTVGNPREIKGVSFEDHINSISNTWLKSHVGKRWSYSNIGYDLVGYILQVRSGKPFAEYMKEKVFEPLKMPNTSLDPVFIKNHDNRAVGHHKHYKKLPLEIPVPAAGGVYSSARELARFVQFHLNYGSLDDQTILSEDLVKQMYSPSPTTSRQYGLGLEYYPKNGRGHGGAGYGFSSVMVWVPDYGIGGLILINEFDSDNNHEQHRIQVYSLLRKLLNNGIVEKIDSFMENAKEVEPVEYQLPDPDKFTPYKPDWKEYLGTYRYFSNNDRKLCLYADIALALGYPNPDMYEKVYEKDGFLEISGRRLDEHLPSLFFSSDGYRLDFRGPVPTWQNMRMKKVK